jgi:hypothetical protein
MAADLLDAAPPGTPTVPGESAEAKKARKEQRKKEKEAKREKKEAKKARKEEKEKKNAATPTVNSDGVKESQWDAQSFPAMGGSAAGGDDWGAFPDANDEQWGSQSTTSVVPPTPQSTTTTTSTTTTPKTKSKSKSKNKTPSASIAAPPTKSKAAAVGPLTGDLWSCHVCTFENQATVILCSVCSAKRQAGATKPTWTCPVCTFTENALARSRCEMCERPKP